MTITDVRIRMLNPEGRMRAVASVTFDAEFVVHDLRVIEGHDGLFVAIPSRRNPGDEGGGFRDIAHPTNPECRDRIQAAVLEAYEGEAAALQQSRREDEGDYRGGADGECPSGEEQRHG